MQLWAQINLWVYHHPEQSSFFERMDIDARIDKALLFDAMMFELGELETVDRDSEWLWCHFNMFFKKWKIPIEQLLNTLEYDYDPMVNVDYQVSRNLGREVLRALGRDVIRELTDAITKHMNEETNQDKVNIKGTKRNVTRDVNETYGEDVKNTHSDNMKDVKHGTDTLDETDRHYVSAFNQLSPTDADTYSDRDTIDRNETHDQTDNKDTSGEWEQGKDSSTVTNDVTSDVTDIQDDTDTNTATERGEQEDRKQNETTGTKEDESTGTKEQEGTHKVGIDGITNQELIDSQRNVVQFNIYNWIVDRIAREFVIGLW